MNYKFDNSLADSTRRNADAAVFHNSAFATAENSKPLHALRTFFQDASSDDFGYVDFGNPADVQALTDKITIAFWLKSVFASGTTAPLLNKWENGTGFYIGSVVTNPTTLERNVIWKISSTELISTRPVPADFSWQHIVCVYDGAQLKVYQDGALSGSVPYSGNIPATTVNMLMGRQADGLSTARSTGVLDELRIYNRALSDDEIRALHNHEAWPSATARCAKTTLLTSPPCPYPVPAFNGQGRKPILRHRRTLSSVRQQHRMRALIP